MNYLTVRLWGEELGRLVWDARRHLTYFQFRPDVADRPDVAPLLNPVGQWRVEMPVYGDGRRIYQGLPPFIADSLPDSWGNKVFDRWVKQNRIPSRDVTPLYKLMFIGRRGMGALEFEPSAPDLDRWLDVDLRALYSLSLDILAERETTVIDHAEELTRQALLAVGTSAGGRQMKAIVAIDPVTGDIRSGQTDGLEGYEYCIIKFEDEVVPTSEIEMAYYNMALDAGIEMERCRLIRIDGVNHFLTRRFDRKDGQKVHMQTLAAINPDADSYEALIETCRSLGLTDAELTEVYRRMVFNVLANNTDDHNKNFAFLLDRGGRWKLAPAYDMTFIFDVHANGPQRGRCMSLYGRVEDTSLDDLIDVARENNIRNPEGIIARVAGALKRFGEYSAKYSIPQKWSHIIEKTLNDNLIAVGMASPAETPAVYTDSIGRRFSDLIVELNTRGIYCVTVTIDGQRHKRYVRPGKEPFDRLRAYELHTLSPADTLALLEILFPKNS